MPKDPEEFQGFHRGTKEVLREVYELFSKLCATDNSEKSQNQFQNTCEETFGSKSLL